MTRRDLVQRLMFGAGLLAAKGSRAAAPERSAVAGAGPLSPPRTGKIPVAFVVTNEATVIDFAGPWEVFQDVHVEGRGTSMDEMMPFDLFTVSEHAQVLSASGGLRIVPNYTFDAAPTPRVVVVGAQQGRTPAVYEWLRTKSRTADVTMSVCTGAFQLAGAGLLAGLEATTHHLYLDKLAKEFPDVKVLRGLRFVEGPRISTAGGLTSGIDLALRVVERYFGRTVAQGTAAYLEYQGTGWIVN
ncbi:MAG TPA: DJ-1/PfpI family protein [Vicinamibacteria bacterium]|nr:DJ-1/PfpI family protein [Vicinamibacteria bacterium]